MRSSAKISFVVAVAMTLALVPCQPSNADLMLFTVDGPKRCPDGLTIKSKAGKDGLVQFDVSVDPEQISHNESYKGRIKPHAVLQIAKGEEQLASVALHGSTEGKQTQYQFSVSPAATTSELQLGVSLYEKDGSPTFGGDVRMQIRLAGFEPKTEKTGDSK